MILHFHFFFIFWILDLYIFFIYLKIWLNQTFVWECTHKMSLTKRRKFLLIGLLAKNLLFCTLLSFSCTSHCESMKQINFANSNSSINIKINLTSSSYADVTLLLSYYIFPYVHCFYWLPCSNSVLALGIRICKLGPCRILLKTQWNSSQSICLSDAPQKLQVTSYKD